MRAWLGHVATFLFGLTVAVTFYEGRRLVVNTADALSAATTLHDKEHDHQAAQAKAKKQEEEARQAALDARLARREARAEAIANGEPPPQRIGKAGKVRDPDAAPRGKARRRGRRRMPQGQLGAPRGQMRQPPQLGVPAHRVDAGLATDADAEDTDLPPDPAAP